jgi:hypothetical protein
MCQLNKKNCVCCLEYIKNYPMVFCDDYKTCNIISSQNVLRSQCDECFSIFGYVNLDFRINLCIDKVIREKTDLEKQLEPSGAELAILKMKKFQNS